MAGTLDGKVAIVTGAAQGIGKCYAETLGREGASVVLADIKDAETQANARAIEGAGGRAHAVVADVSSKESVEAMCRAADERYGGLDILVNNAAIYYGYVHYGLDEIPLDYWNKFLDVNTTSVLLCTQAAVPHMEKRGGGKIINQSSDGAQGGGNQYSLTKLLVQGLTVGFARTLGPQNITVNAIAPGVINTEATLVMHPDEQLQEMIQAKNAIKRVGTAEDLAEFVAFIVSDKADWITGQIFHINGGFWMRPA